MLGIFGNNMFFRSQYSLGIDISDLSVKVVQIKKTRSGKTVSSFGASNISFGNITEGEILRPDVVSSAVLEALSNASPYPIKQKQVYCSLPENKTFVRIIEMPEISVQEMKGALKWQIEENIPLGADQIYFDWKILDKSFNPNSHQMQVLVVAVSKIIVDSHVSMLESAGLELVGMEVESLAQAHALIQHDTQGSVLIVDMGSRKTSLSFFVDGAVCFTSSIPVSAQMITDSISKSFSISSEEAEVMKMEKGIGSFVQRDLLFESVEPILESLIAQIQSSIDFFIGSLKYRAQIDTTIVCGGGSNTKGLTGYLSKRMNRNVIKGNAWTHMQFKKKLPIIPQDESVRYATAIGLALRGFEEV